MSAALFVLDLVACLLDRQQQHRDRKHSRGRHSPTLIADPTRGDDLQMRVCGLLCLFMYFAATGSAVITAGCSKS